MKKNLIAVGLLGTAIVSGAAYAQTAQPADRAATPAVTPAASSDKMLLKSKWRASKLIGLNVYNDKNEKLGDINELLLDKSGKVEGVVIGVGGFLGMGEHDIKVDMSKLKFVDEPARTATTTTTTTTTGEATRPATTSATTTRSTDKQWYPDHAVLSGATKEQLKSMTQFKYN